ncbi:ribbon-helix-helix protein, CopG family [Ciceribacter sp. L1K23]|uniref:ribbon-helix-helix protein, CopG family n=1 Tax=Ciceribacter sp. L1K23 TaxID=2820276 RepID=UPI001B812BFB|nr:ribbon-helix-helix protein, CopG family [Ciceribacter sp. L1K23]MBR0556271.1 ribbon-helix-helix protein, CopG family [Ciceribacter sp. L1K23]
MRIRVDIPRSHLDGLDRLASERKVSRAALIRAAVDELLSKERTETVRDAFGLWNGELNGLAFQRKLRHEW